MTDPSTAKWVEGVGAPYRIGADGMNEQVSAAYLNTLQQRVEKWETAATETGQSNWTKAQWRQLAMLAKHSKELAESQLEAAVRDRDAFANTIKLLTEENLTKTIPALEQAVRERDEARVHAAESSEYLSSAEHESDVAHALLRRLMALLEGEAVTNKTLAAFLGSILAS